MPPTWTPAPTNTLAPTNTPAPTLTARPTSTPFTGPIATPLVQASAPTDESGTVTEISTPDTIPGASLDANNEQVAPEGELIDLAPITAANASQIALIQAQERVLATDLALSAGSTPDTIRIAAAMPDGVRIFTGADLTADPQFLPDSGDMFGFEVGAVAFSPDGSRLASGNTAGELVIWDLTTYERLFTIPAHDNTIWDVVYSPDGTQIVTGGELGWIKVWDAATGELVREVETGDAVYDLAVYPLSGLVVASGVSTSRARVWNMSTGEELAPLSGHSSEARAVAFSPDGETLASGGDEGSVRIWTVAGAQAGEPEAVLGGHISMISVLAYSPDSSLIAVGTSTGGLAIWDLTTNEKLFDAQAHIPWLTAIVWLPDQSGLITAGLDNTVRVWGVPAE
jgi:WD40 repeat protein